MCHALFSIMSMLLISGRSLFFFNLSGYQQSGQNNLYKAAQLKRKLILHLISILNTNFLFRGETLDVFLHREAVYGVSVSPTSDSVFASAGEDGQVLLYDMREPVTTGWLSCIC